VLWSPIEGDHSSDLADILQSVGEVIHRHVGYSEAPPATSRDRGHINLRSPESVQQVRKQAERRSLPRDDAVVVSPAITRVDAGLALGDTDRSRGVDEQGMRQPYVRHFRDSGWIRHTDRGQSLKQGTLPHANEVDGKYSKSSRRGFADSTTFGSRTKVSRPQALSPARG